MIQQIEFHINFVSLPGGKVNGSSYGAISISHSRAGPVLMEVACISRIPLNEVHR
jgi:hypothetical protein